MTEIWKDIKDYEGLYQISNFGRVKALEISNYIMGLLLDEAIRKEKDRIDKLIDMEIERKLKK